jgi:uncharacterized protein with HEPN domain
MSPSQLDFIAHILSECEFILRSSHLKKRDEILDDEILSRALVRSLEVIGEATKRIDEGIKSRYIHIDWKNMSRMRDRLIHHYFGVDFDIVFNTITTDIPELANELERILRIERDRS